jgi:hypothetical protein
VDVRLRAITPSAGRHGISAERIRAAVRACPLPPYDDNPETGDDDLLLFLGPDSHANPLEVVGREHGDGTVTIFHAMPVRPAYREAYEAINGIR